MNRYIGILRRCELYFIREELEKYGLQTLEGRLLSVLTDDCTSQEILCCQLNLDKGQIAKSISALEEKGLVIRRINEKNRRQKLVSLTDRGREMVGIIEGIYKSWDNISYQGFTQEEILLYRDFIKRMAENAMEYKRKDGGYING